MDWLEVLGDINYWAVIVATLSSFVVGMVWYNENVFGKTWMKLRGLTKKDVEDRDAMMKAMGQTAVEAFIGAAVLAALMYGTFTDGWADGAIFGAVVGFGISMTSVGTHNAFSRISMTLTRIDGLHDVVKFAVMGAVIGGIGF